MTGNLFSFPDNFAQEIFKVAWLFLKEFWPLWVILIGLLLAKFFLESFFSNFFEFLKSLSKKKFDRK